MRIVEWKHARLGLTALAAGGGLFLMLHADVAQACTCLPATVESSYDQSSDVAALTPLFGFRRGSERLYVARVDKPYKGCTEAGDLVLLATASSSASCGGQLTVGEKYLLNTQRNGSLLGIPRLSFSSCSYNLPSTELSDSDRAFLDGRSVCCGDECTCADGSDPVLCFANPCDVTPACDAAATCEANYCGGCNAEFYDESGYAVCQASGECESDADCGAGEWCRQAPSEPGEPNESREPVYECVPFAAAGESCEGFTLPWFFERCAPGLVCDTPDFVVDAPGTCRVPCTDNTQCPEAEYCAADGSCDSDGQCELPLDCTQDGNTFIAPLCLGYPTCEVPTGCGWTCGDPACMDSWGHDFGPCDAVLGVGVFGGSCQTISGCDAGPFTLFESEQACREACEVAPPAECKSDADCTRTGCSGQVCAAEQVFTTCEFREEYACYADPAVTRCGCDAGRCGFAQTPELASCLAGASEPAL